MDRVFILFYCPFFVLKCYRVNKQATANCDNIHKKKQIK